MFGRAKSFSDDKAKLYGFHESILQTLQSAGYRYLEIEEKETHQSPWRNTILPIGEYLPTVIAGKIKEVQHAKIALAA